jgi:3-isopropylmalate dehydrogenase
MPSNNVFNICVLPGDGIGIEVTGPCVDVLERAAKRTGGFVLNFEQYEAGAFAYQETGNALPKATMDAARSADAILLGAMGWPDIRYPDGTEIAPQLDLRSELGLYAGVRPVRSVPGMPAILADPRAATIDFVLIRESTEGLFSSRGKGVVTEDREARDTLVITRDVSERLFQFSFDLARSRRKRDKPGLVTCVDKANVFASFAFFRKIFDEVALRNRDLSANHAYVDATALYMVQKPWSFDVLVTENMFGDILSDLAAGLCGGMGFAPSADIGDRHAVFQPCHGTAPDITGQGKANPIAAFLSGAMMLEWLGERHGCDESVRAGGLVRNAVDAALASGVRPFEIGGTAGTLAIARAALEYLEKSPAEAA